MTDRIGARIAEMHARLVERRRDLHMHPELGFDELRTSSMIAEACRALGLEVKTGVAKTGVVARLKGTRDKGRTIALRADMDALPIREDGTRAYASTIEGRMHACGHDAHVSMALGAAEVLASLRDEIDGEVVFLFQPAEEGPGGAKPMIAEGALDGVDFILGQHVLPLFDAGEIAISDGPAMAAADEFVLKIIGKGGHGAYPHLTVDSIQVAAQVVTALQAIVARGVDPLKSAVISVGSIHGGYNFNVIAPAVEMRGTVRTLEAKLRKDVAARIETVVRGVCDAYGARYELDYTFGYPPVVNPPEGFAFVKKLASRALGEGAVHVAAPSMGGEDFAYYLREIPGCFYFVGCKKHDAEVEGYNLHSPTFDLDERALDVGVRLFVEGTFSYLSDTRG